MAGGGLTPQNQDRQAARANHLVGNCPLPPLLPPGSRMSPARPDAQIYALRREVVLHYLGQIAIVLGLLGFPRSGLPCPPQRGWKRECRVWSPSWASMPSGYGREDADEAVPSSAWALPPNPAPS